MGIFRVEWRYSRLNGDAQFSLIQRGDFQSRFGRAAKSDLRSIFAVRRKQLDFNKIVSGLAKKDPIRALRFFDENVKDATANEGMNYQSMIVQQWAQKDFDAAARYALTIKDRQTRRNVARWTQHGETGRRSTR